MGGPHFYSPTLPSAEKIPAGKLHDRLERADLYTIIATKTRPHVRTALPLLICLIAEMRSLNFNEQISMDVK